MQVPVDQCHFFNFDSLPYCRDQPLAASNQISDLEEFLMCEFLSCKISAFINKNWHGSLGIGSVSWKQLCICKWDMLILIWQKHVQYILAWQMQHFDTFWGNNTGTKKILRTRRRVGRTNHQRSWKQWASPYIQRCACRSMASTWPTIDLPTWSLT